MAKAAPKRKSRVSRKRLIAPPPKARRAASALEKYRGIGNKGTSSGRKAVIRAIRQLRGR